MTKKKKKKEQKPSPVQNKKKKKRWKRNIKENLIFRISNFERKKKS